MVTAAIRDLFAPEPGLAYLDAATYGLPPLPTVRALDRALSEWQSGRGDWLESWDREGERCRALFATLIGAEPEAIALIPTVSVGVGLVAAALSAEDEVVVPEDEFTSVLYPLLVAGRTRGTPVREAPFDALADAITAATRLVALSLTQSQSGQTAPLAVILEAAARHDSRVLIDATHAIPWVPIADHLPVIDYLICHGYKHLLCPRGVSFLYVRRDRWDDFPPWLAGWRAGAPRYERSYGGPLSLAPDAARFDVSLAWHAWVGARPALELLVAWQQSGALAAVRDLAARLAAGLDQPPPSASIVAMPVADSTRVAAALTDAGVKCAVRAGNIRLSPHVYNTDAEIDRTIAAIRAVT